MLGFTTIAPIHNANVPTTLCVRSKLRAGTNLFFLYHWYVTSSPTVKRELFVTTKRCPTGQHTPAHGITATPTPTLLSAFKKLQTTFFVRLVPRPDEYEGLANQYTVAVILDTSTRRDISERNALPLRVHAVQTLHFEWGGSGAPQTLPRFARPSPRGPSRVWLQRRACQHIGNNGKDTEQAPATTLHGILLGEQHNAA